MELKQFGKDHWSTFAYAEYCCVDSRGMLDNRRLRINENKRPIRSRSNGLGWDPKYGTRAKNGSIPDPEHDDIDCLEDLEREGFIEFGTLANLTVKLTDEGKVVAAALRSHKADGGQFSTFEWNLESK